MRLALLSVATWAATVSAQTYSTCNPLTAGSCPPDTALGKAVSVDFTQGPSDSFTPQGNPQYSSNGAAFTVTKGGDAPQLTSKWYIMFGHVDFVVKAAPGVGIVSSAVLQSDDLDEIDWEWLGGDDQQVQSNFFGKGLTTGYNRGAFHPAPGNHDGFSTYSVDWTATQITWSINGKAVRTLAASDTNGYPYPQTPMMVKVGAWSAGDPANAPGTISWAGGTTNYQSGPFTMYVKSIAVTDYSTGSQYKYTGTDGTWQSITAVGGKVNSQGNGAQPAAVAPDSGSSSSSTGGPQPFSGTHKDSSSASQPNAGNWSPTTLTTSTTGVVTTYPGLPSGWTVTSSGKVLPPSSAPTTPPPDSSPTASPQDGSQPAPPAAQDGYEVVTTYDQQGFPVVVTQPAGFATQARHYNDQGFLITPAALDSRSSPTAAAGDASSSPSASPVVAAAAEASSASPSVSKVSASATHKGGSSRTEIASIVYLTVVAGAIAGVLCL